MGRKTANKEWREATRVPHRGAEPTEAGKAAYWAAVKIADAKLAKAKAEAEVARAKAKLAKAKAEAALADAEAAWDAWAAYSDAIDAKKGGAS